MANTKKEKIDLTYTQVIDPTLGGNLPKEKTIKKASTKASAKKTVAKNGGSSTTKKTTVTKKTTTTKKQDSNAVTKKASSKVTPVKKSVQATKSTKAEPVKKVASTKPKMKYDDLTYTQIIDPTLGGNLPSAKKEKVKEIPKDIVKEKEELTYTQMLDLGTKVNVKDKKEIEPEVELFEDEESSLSVVIASILVLALIVVGIIIASHLIK